jgi:hypothetical protein
MAFTNIQAMSQLPLSWARTNTTQPILDQVKLPFTAANWIPTAAIPHDLSFDKLYRQYLSPLPHGFVLQSVNLALRNYLHEQGAQSAPMGTEAILDLPWRGKRSVRELARRGRRHGAVREVELNRGNQLSLVLLIQESAARQDVQLRHIERANFDESTRCFVLETPEKKWLGAITISKINAVYYHTEMLLRRADAPTGVMEALVTAIVQTLTTEGTQHLSLGTVSPIPAEEMKKIFIPHRRSSDPWLLSQIAFRVGRNLKFVFNADGLWRFKNKFSPRWEPLYLVSSSKLSLATVIGLLNEIGESLPIIQTVRERCQALLAFRRDRIATFANRGPGEMGDYPFCRKRLKLRLISLV